MLKYGAVPDERVGWKDQEKDILKYKKGISMIDISFLFQCG